MLALVVFTCLALPTWLAHLAARSSLPTETYPQTNQGTPVVTTTAGDGWWDGGMGGRWMTERVIIRV